MCRPGGQARKSAIEASWIWCHSDVFWFTSYTCVDSLSSIATHITLFLPDVSLNRSAGRRENLIPETTQPFKSVQIVEPVHCTTARQKPIIICMAIWGCKRVVLSTMWLFKWAGGYWERQGDFKKKYRLLDKLHYKIYPCGVFEILGIKRFKWL